MNSDHNCVVYLLIVVSYQTYTIAVIFKSLDFTLHYCLDWQMFSRGDIAFYCSYGLYRCSDASMVTDYNSGDIAMQYLAPIVCKMMEACFASPLSDAEAVYNLFVDFSRLTGGQYYVRRAITHASLYLMESDIIHPPRPAPGTPTGAVDPNHHMYMRHSAMMRVCILCEQNRQEWEGGNQFEWFINSREYLLAICMAGHWRLGAGSQLEVLYDDVLMLVGRSVIPEPDYHELARVARQTAPPQ